MNFLVMVEEVMPGVHLAQAHKREIQSALAFRPRRRPRGYPPTHEMEVASVEPEDVRKSEGVLVGIKGPRNRRRPGTHVAAAAQRFNVYSLKAAHPGRLPKRHLLKARYREAGATP